MTVIENKYERKIRYENANTAVEEKIISGLIEKKDDLIKKTEKRIDVEFFDQIRIFKGNNDELYTVFDKMYKACEFYDKKFAAIVTQELREVSWCEGKKKTDIKNVIRIMVHQNNSDCKYRDIPFFSNKKRLNEIMLKELSELLDDSKCSYKEFKGGKMDVIFSPRAAAYFVHEILGHPLELDLISTNKSIYKEKNIDEKIMPEYINVSECPEDTRQIGMIYGDYDDEGKDLINTDIIKGGVLVSPITYKRCSEMKRETLNRMHNFILRPNESGCSLDRIIARSSNAIVIDDVLYGYYNLAMGDFMLYCGKSRRVKNGEVVSYHFGVRINEKILELKNIIKEIGNDYNATLGFCSKQNQIITVGMGAPSMVLSDINVTGGSENVI